MRVGMAINRIGAISRILLVLVLRPRLFFGGYERSSRRLVSPLIPLPSWQTHRPPTENEG